MKIWIFFLLWMTSFVFSSCNLKENKKRTIDNKSILAYIDSMAITYSEVDNKIRQELFDELNRIYIIRKIALDELLKERLLEIEAKKNNISVKDLLNSLYTKKINKSALSKFSVLNQYDNGIPTLERTLTYYDINSKKRRTLLINKYKEFVLLQQNVQQNKESSGKCMILFYILLKYLIQMIFLELHIT